MSHLSIKRQRFLARVAAALLAGFIVVATTAVAGPAAGHDYVVDSHPSADQVVGSSLYLVSITFSELPFGFEGSSAIEVTSPDGTIVSAATTAIDGATLSTAVRYAGPGVYQVVWQNASGDGHPISGEYQFTWSQAVSAPGPETTESADAAIEGANSNSGVPVEVVIAIGVAILTLLAAAIYFVSKPRHQGTDDRTA